MIDHHGRKPAIERERKFKPIHHLGLTGWRKRSRREVFATFWRIAYKLDESEIFSVKTTMATTGVRFGKLPRMAPLTGCPATISVVSGRPNPSTLWLSPSGLKVRNPA